MTRVVHYGLSTNRGGIETYILRLAQHVDPSEFRFDFVHNDMGAPCYQRELSDMGSRFYPITPRRTSPRTNRRELDELFAREQFDIFHCHINTLSYVEPIRAALRHGCEVIVHSHNSGASKSLVTNVLHRLHARTLPRSRVHRVAVSKLAGDWMFGEGDQFLVINNGVDTGRFAFSEESRRRLRSELGLGDKFVIGNVGAFLYAKNHEFLLRVFAEALKLRPSSALVLVGAGDLEAAVRRHVKELGLSDHVHFLGTRTDVPDLMSAMDAMVFPSRYEGFPLAVLEAQASGLRCWISDAITSEVEVTDGCSLLPLDAPPSAWAQTIVSDSLSVERLDAHARVKAAGFDVQTAMQKIVDLYRRITP